jgi:hypothetical protein
MNLIPTVKAPNRTRLIKGFLLLNDIKEDEKYKLNNTVYTFIYFINSKLYKMPFLLIKPKNYKINTLLKKYTDNKTDIIHQFKHLLNHPVIIEDMVMTNIIIEVIYILSELYEIDFKKYINNVNLDNLTDYYHRNIHNLIIH